MIKTTLIGGASGKGEAVIIEFPDKKIGLIDSCIDFKTKESLSLKYLGDNKLDFDHVVFLVLTHYHQDHYLGIYDILKACKNAKFYTSDVLSNKLFLLFFERALQVRKEKNCFLELKNVFDLLKKRNQKVYSLNVNSKALLKSNNYQVNILSPNANTVAYFDNIYKNWIKKMLNNPNIFPTTHNFNLQSVVLRIKYNNENLLLGADLHYHSDIIGWEPIMKQLVIDKENFKICKIPHHGSVTGYNHDDWKSIFNKTSYFKLTPYVNSGLPKVDMIANILKHSDNCFITSKKGYQKINIKLRKKIEKLGINAKKVSNSSGVVSFELTNLGVNVTLFNADKLK